MCMKSKCVGMLILLIGLLSQTAARAEGVKIDLSGAGWKLWRDGSATWRKDHLYIRHEASGLFKRDDDPALSDPDKAGTIPLEQLPVNPPTGGWEALDRNAEADVAVPGTVEEYLWNKVPRELAFTGKAFPVSWWWREFTLPNEVAGKRIILKVGACRHRSEIYIDRKLCGYDAVGNTPYEFDVTSFVQGGGKYRIAFRITNPGGNLSWTDNPTLRWGDTQTRVDLGHAFGGITGPVVFSIVDPVFIEDLWIRNTPAMRDIVATLTLKNTTDKEVRRDVEVVIREKESRAVVARVPQSVTLPPGQAMVAVPVSVPEGKLWSPETPNLYICSVQLKENRTVADAAEKTFGFRWFDVQGVGKNACNLLNGKRVRVLSAISWGFWPQSGLIATPELAAKQVSIAKKIGLNCLNHHRCIGDPKTLDEADRQGLMYYIEPGGCEGYQGDAFFYAMSREKILRMVKRDRSHPSVIRYNMINEPIHAPTEGQIRTLRNAHTLDPSRIITWASGPQRRSTPENRVDGLWRRPESMTDEYTGWVEPHNSFGTETYVDSNYNGPKSFRCKASRADQIFWWGEEGAIGTLPRLQLLKERCAQPGYLPGWDGSEWLLHYEQLNDWLKESGLGQWFSVDSLTQTIGAKQYYYQGRIIENFMIDDIGDGYVVNGWENDICTSFSGLVDLGRNPKTDNLDLIRYYTRPLYVAVKLRQKIAHVGEEQVADFWIVNEKGVKGEAELRIEVLSPSKQIMVAETKPVKISGGNCYGELLLEGIHVPVKGEAGYYTVQATLVQNGAGVVTGRDDLLAVDWKSIPLPTRGAVLEADGGIAKFLKTQKRMDLPAYSEQLSKLDYVLVGRMVQDETQTTQPALRETGPLSPELLDGLLKRAKEDGTTLIFFEPVPGLDSSKAHWAMSRNDGLVRQLARRGVFPGYRKWMVLAADWLVGSYIAGSGPLFEGLPDRQAFSWEYQLLAESKRNIALDISGVPVLVGAVTDTSARSGNSYISSQVMGAGVCAADYGKGRIILSTLPLIPNLQSERGAGHVVRKLFCNMIRMANVSQRK